MLERRLVSTRTTEIYIQRFDGEEADDEVRAATG
jgi:hypothetical protein